LLTGLSGSGKTTALKVLEDQGFSTIDNLPVSLIPSLLQLVHGNSSHGGPLVLGMDVRGPEFLKSYPRALKLLKKTTSPFEIWFLDCKEKILIQRFSETRRPHPLKRDRCSLATAIHEEKQKLEPLRKSATYVLDTSAFTVHQLKKALLAHLSSLQKVPPMEINLLSFGYKFGLPHEADMVLDVRFLPNPYFEPKLKNRPGTAPSVMKYLMKKKETKEFLQHSLKLFRFLIPQFQEEGKSQLTIAIGCTGGRHRSVSLVEYLQKKLSTQGRVLNIIHRDLGKEI